MAKIAIVFTCVVLWPLVLCKEIQVQWIAWWVGQGQFITRVSGQECRHYDVGGDLPIPKEWAQVCQKKLNRVFISHGDWDHLGLISQLRRTGGDVCLNLAPTHTLSLQKSRLLNQVPDCANSILKLRQRDQWVSPFRQEWVYSPTPHPQLKQNPNNVSQVIFISGVLLPGDSPKYQEKLWARHFPCAHEVRYLIVGHHGSRTSTSGRMLDRFPNLQMAVISARRNRYGHPHAPTLRELRKRNIAVLKTEDWGHIHIHMRPMELRSACRH